MSDPVRQLSDGSTQVGGITVNTPYENNKDAGVKVEDFLQLMIAQLTNQDFMNPVDDTQYVTQLAQFATMQSMQELSHYSQTNYVSSLVGKTVTAASYGIGGTVNKETGIVTKVNFSGDEFTISVNGKEFQLSQIMTVNDTNSAASKNVLEEANKIALINMETTNNSFKFRWDAPTTDEAEKEGLRYDVYYTTDPSLDFSDLNGVKKGKAAATGLMEPNYELTDLAPGTTYYVNVVVRNGNGDEAIYQKATVVTKE
ncbi:fibronectin type III domain-containing protein [Ruminococcaceae bacterium OttesenSCG-928-I18]|nr:fibronectin type III domain-containing protein [Ruminococcaceae bacterium OttesenSCG-928-I18]